MSINHPTPLDVEAVPCRTNPERMFPAGTGAYREAREESAKSVCNRGANGSPCPLRDRCLAYALQHAVEGVWGGTTWSERQDMRAANGILPVSITTGVARLTVYRRTA